MRTSQSSVGTGATRVSPVYRPLTVLAQDPSTVDHEGKVLLSRVTVPAEELEVGPWGYRTQVVDYDSTSGKSYRQASLPADEDPLAGVGRDRLLKDPRLHSVNCYGLVMRTLSRFERALGRRVSWGFHGHHLNIVPHAFSEANAYYTRDDHALLFGYFPSRSAPQDHVFTCLSHDIVVHETTHAILDGLRPRFMTPSSPDQAAFHEAFADVVALLSVFSLPGVAEAILRHALGGPARSLDPTSVTKEKLMDSGLLGLAEEFGTELQDVRGNALRRSVTLDAKPERYHAEEGPWAEPHRRGEILAAAVLNTFVDAWFRAVGLMGDTYRVPRAVVAAEGARVADVLLTMVMRAIDYTPPVHLDFADFLSAVLTIDTALWPDDAGTKYRLRDSLIRNFSRFGIEPVTSLEEYRGCWRPPRKEMRYDRNHYEQMRAEPDEVFRFIWENRGGLGLSERAYSRVLSVRPVVRVGTDGFVLRETVVEHVETLHVHAKDLHTVRYPHDKRGIEKPEGMPDDLEIALHGGGTLIFDDFGLLKYHVHNAVADPDRQSERLSYLWKRGYPFGESEATDFDALHQARAHGATDDADEVW